MSRLNLRKTVASCSRNDENHSIYQATLLSFCIFQVDTSYECIRVFDSDMYTRRRIQVSYIGRYQRLETITVQVPYPGRAGFLDVVSGLN